MGKTYQELNNRLIDFMKQQKMFFVATAPLSPGGHVNVSPKGYDSFTVLGPKSVAYLDLGGSGIETHAHVMENGRITIMFCAFEGTPYILRLYGRGEALTFHDPEFAELMPRFPNLDRGRGIIRVNLTRIMDSCGWGVPFYAFKGERDQLTRYHAAKSYEDWVYAKNAESIDGLPGLTRPQAPESKPITDPATACSDAE